MNKFIIKSFLVLSIITAVLMSCINKSHADDGVCNVQCPVAGPGDAWAHYQDDHFRWTDPNTQVHLLIGFSGALITSELLTRYAGLKPWQSALIGTVLLGMIGTTKEVMFDQWTGRADIKSWWGGAATGGLTFLVIHF